MQVTIDTTSAAVVARRESFPQYAAVLMDGAKVGGVWLAPQGYYTGAVEGDEYLVRAEAVLGDAAEGVARRYEKLYR